MTAYPENGAERVRILRVRAADGGAKLVLTVDVSSEGKTEREELGIFAARFDKAPAAGEIDAETLAILRREAALCGALEQGLRCLSAGGASRVSLTRKLRAKGVDKEIAEAAVEELDARGYLREADGALREAEKGLAKLWGDRRILAELRRKGYGDEALAEVRERLSEEDGAARCRRLLQKRRLLPDGNAAGDRRAADKLIAALMRYGYGADEIRDALRAELEERE